MNTRGLTELVILTLGVQYGVLDGEMFTLMVIMAVVTTVMTSPLLNVVYPQRILERDIAAAEREAMGLTEAYTALVVIDDTERDRPLVNLACDMVGRESPAQVVITRVVRRTTPKPEVASGLTADLALMAGVADELRQLARLVEARGVKASVASRFSEHPWAEVAELAASTDADVVLVRAGWGVADGSADARPWPTDLQGTVAVVSGELGDAHLSPHGPVAVVHATDPDGRAALRLAAQTALGRSVPLQLRSAEDGRRAGRRAAGVADTLRRSGVDIAPDESDLLASLVVAGMHNPVDDELTPVIRVHAGLADRDRDMDETLAGISAGPAPA
jgi:hypothetical protein